MAREISDQEIAAARARGAQKRAAGLAATNVSYDPTKRRIVLELTNGGMVGIPVSSLPHIAGATDADLLGVALDGEGVITIESLDADYSVAALVANSIGRSAVIEFGRTGGQARSEAKSASSRANGAKGGRPPSGTVKRIAHPRGSFTGVKKAAKSGGKPSRKK